MNQFVQLEEFKRDYDLINDVLYYQHMIKKQVQTKRFATKQEQVKKSLIDF